MSLGALVFLSVAAPFCVVAAIYFFSGQRRAQRRSQYEAWKLHRRSSNEHEA